MLTFLGQANAKIENQVIAYIDEKIITSEDIRQEIIYLNIVSGEKLNELKKEINTISHQDVIDTFMSESAYKMKDSLLKEKGKENEKKLIYILHNVEL